MSNNPQISTSAVHVPKWYIQYDQLEIKFFFIFYRQTMLCVHYITNYKQVIFIVKIQMCKLLEKYLLVPDSGLCSVKIHTNSI